jgi:D-psicose/D-tagatose/L-ribulose 3-epimerase
MKIAISNLAWQPPEENLAIELLSNNGTRGLEIALTKIWSNPIGTSRDELLAYKSSLLKKNIQICAITSVLFGQPELVLFKDSQTRTKTLNYLKKLLPVCARLGANVMVFGSPKSRSLNSLKHEEAWEIGQEFFYHLGDAAKKEDIFIVIEPLSKIYGSDFIKTTDEAIKFINQTNHPNIRLHIDTGSMINNQEDYLKSINDGFTLLKHFHLSQTDFSVINSKSIDHQVIAKLLNSLNYQNWISIEMLAKERGNLEQIKNSLKFVKSIYE